MRSSGFAWTLATLVCAAGSLGCGGVDLPPDFEAVGRTVGTQGLPERLRHVPSGVTLVLIEPGRFTRGSPKSEASRDGDEVQHEAVIADAFYLGETEITVGQWERVMGPDPEEEAEDGELPKTGVSFHDATALLEQLNEGGEGVWRLPTEAEWEYACRAGTTTAFSFGPQVTTEQANYDGHRPYADGARGERRDVPVPVRSLPANPWGLYGMHGNVWEWCEDLYVLHPERGETAKDFPGASRVMRGGSFLSRADQLRCAYRDGYPPMSPGEKYGVRVAVSLPNGSRAR